MQPRPQKRFDPIVRLIVSVLLIASGTIALTNAVMTGRMSVPRSDDTGDAFTTEFGLLALLYIGVIVIGVVGLILFVVRDLGEGREPPAKRDFNS